MQKLRYQGDRRSSLRSGDYADRTKSSLGYLILAVGGLGGMSWWFAEDMSRHWQFRLTALTVMQSGIASRVSQPVRACFSPFARPWASTCQRQRQHNRLPSADSSFCSQTWINLKFLRIDLLPYPLTRRFRPVSRTHFAYRVFNASSVGRLQFLFLPVCLSGKSPPDSPRTF